MTESLDGRVFIVASNSDHGAASDATRFYFRESNGTIQADYRGGSVVRGSILGKRSSATRLTLRYQCELEGGEVRAGSADVDVSQSPDGLLALEMQWQWLDGEQESGTSSYIEVAADPLVAHSLYAQAQRYGFEYLEQARDRRVFPSETAIAALDAFEEPLPENGTSAASMLELLHEVGSPASVNQIAGRYFGFVNGGAPAAGDGGAFPG